MSRRFIGGRGNNKWTASSHSPGGSGRGHGRRGGRFSNHSYTRNEATATTSASNKWVRPTVNTEGSQGGDDKKTAAETEKNSTALDTNTVKLSGDKRKNDDMHNSEDNETITTSSDVHKPEHNLERRGKNKLIMKKKNESESSSLIIETKVEESVSSNNVVDKSEQVHERRGRHKLVMKKEEDGSETITKSAQQKDAVDSNKYSWTRKSSDNETDETKQRGIQNQSKRSASRTSPAVKRKHPEKIHGPRRICLPLATTEEGKAIDEENDQPQKTMTDFQYKDASARSGRGRGRGRGAVKAMGLVRVKPKNPSETPICPTFSRGLPCNNAKCRYRHDISTEASRPMCVFFQRNGMCSKGDACPFKHVKISWDAEVCPTFERLGYCEDESCVLRHVASKRSKSSAGK